MPDHRNLVAALPLRRRTVLGGVALGAVMLTGLTLAGLFGPRHQHPDPADHPTSADILSGSQPQLEAALLTAQELRAATPGSGSSRVPTVLGRINSESHPASCTILLSEPDELVRRASATVISRPAATAQARSEQQGADNSLLHQVLTTFDADGASSTFQELRRVGDRCRDFGAALDDGTEIRVRTEAVDPTSAPEAFLRLSGETEVFKLTVTGPREVTTGYLAVGQAGTVLSVLHQLSARAAGEPAGTESSPATFLRLLNRAAAKLVPAAASPTPNAAPTSDPANVTVVTSPTIGPDPTGTPTS